MAQVKITFSADKCIGCGACAGLVPSVFSFSGKANLVNGEAVKDQENTFSVTVENDNPMIDALQGMCPGRAISVEAIGATA